MQRIDKVKIWVVIFLASFIIILSYIWNTLVYCTKYYPAFSTKDFKDQTKNLRFKFEA